jgi:hypothetical protein
MKCTTDSKHLDRVALAVTAVWVAIAAFATIVALTGCGEARPLDLPGPGPEPASLGDVYESLGIKFVVGGGIAFGVGLAARIAIGMCAGVIADFLGFGNIWKLALSLGAGFFATGSALYWCSQHMWVVYVAGIASVLAIGVAHRNDVRDWFMGGKSAGPDAVDTANTPTDVIPKPKA